MNTKKFYGTQIVQIPMTNVNDDENSSSDDDHRKNEIMSLVKPTKMLCKASDSESKASWTKEVIIDETDSDSEYEIPLSRLRQSNQDMHSDINVPSIYKSHSDTNLPSTSTSKRCNKSQQQKMGEEEVVWQNRFLAVTEEFVKFKGDETLQIFIQAFKDPIQFFFFFFHRRNFYVYSWTVKLVWCTK